MEFKQSKIFSVYYVKKNNKTVGPFRYEQLKEIMYNKKFKGDELVSEDKQNWIPIREFLPQLDDFLNSDREEMYINTFLKKINKSTEYKVRTTFQITMGPFDNKKLLNMIEEKKIEGDYKIIIDDMAVPYKKIKKRLERLIKTAETQNQTPRPKVKIKETVKPKETKKVDTRDLEEIDNIKSIDFSEISSLNENPKIEIKESKKLSDENIKGLLSTKPLLSLLFTYSLDKLTGVLEITKKSNIYEINFKKGKLAYITSNRAELSLAHYLKIKKISDKYDDDMSDAVIIPKLIAENKINSSEIYKLLTDLVVYRLSEVFKITNGKFLFKQGASTDSTNLNIDFLSQIWKFTIKLVPQKTIDEYIKKIEDFVILKDERRFEYYKYLKLGPTEYKLLNKINNKVTTAQFVKALNKQKPELVNTFKRLIYILYNLRFVTKGKEISSRDISTEIAQLKSKLEQIEKEKNHFFTLGVTQDTPLSKIRKVYIKFSKDFHPDKLSKEKNKELRELKTKYYTYISTAYNSISTQQKLDAYIQELNSGGTEDINTEAIFQAEELFGKCKNALKVGKFEKALQYINEAIELFDNNNEFKVYQLYLNFIFTWQKDLIKAQNYITSLENIMKTMDKYPDGYRFLGRMYKILKKSGKAKENFRKLLSLIPYDSEAKREAR